MDLLNEEDIFGQKLTLLDPHVPTTSSLLFVEMSDMSPIFLRWKSHPTFKSVYCIVKRRGIKNCCVHSIHFILLLHTKPHDPIYLHLSKYPSCLNS